MVQLVAQLPQTFWPLLKVPTGQVIRTTHRLVATFKKEVELQPHPDAKFV